MGKLVLLFSVDQAFVGRDEILAPLKTPAWEASIVQALPYVLGGWAVDCLVGAN